MEKGIVNASLIILAGGLSRRFGCNKCLKLLSGKPLIFHILDRVYGLCSEMFVVISHLEMKPIFENVVHERAKVLIDDYYGIGPLAGIRRGVEEAYEKFVLVLAGDLPFVSKDALSFMLRETKEGGFHAVIPRWPNGFIEPLHAIYHRDALKEAVERSFEKGKLKVSDAISGIRKVRFLEVEELRRFDPELLTFFNINTLEDYMRATEILGCRSVSR